VFAFLPPIAHHIHRPADYPVDTPAEILLEKIQTLNLLKTGYRAQKATLSAQQIEIAKRNAYL
jgi:hypothetical protein